MKKIGILTSGGDCQALNPTMRGVVKGLENLFGDVEIYGFLEGYKGLIYGNYKKMKPMDFSGILIGATRCAPCWKRWNSRRSPRRQAPSGLISSRAAPPA